MPDIALFQPDIPQNLGTNLRTAACFGTNIHIIEPCGFPLDDKRIRRAGMDYIEHVEIIRHISWQEFVDWAEKHNKRTILLSTKAATPYTKFCFNKNDILIAGRESAGVPQYVHDYCVNRIIIPMKAEVRSLNVAISLAIVLSEARRQLDI